MSLQTLESFLKEKGEKETFNLLKKYVIITEKINGHRVYCKKEKNGNILFYSKKKNTPITILDRLLSDLYEPFIKHIISKKNYLENGKYGFYLINNPIDIEYSKKPINNLILTNIPKKSSKNYIKIASELEVSYIKPIFQGILSDEKINDIISYINNKNESLLKFFNEIFNKNCSILASNDEIIEGFVFNFNKHGLYKINDPRFKRKEFQKINTATYELLLIEIFDFIENQNFLTVKFVTKNNLMKRMEFIFEMFNRFVIYHLQNKSLNNLLLSPPPFIYTKGKLNKNYIINKKTYELITSNDKELNDKLEYLLRIFITNLKDFQKPRGIISNTINEKNNYIISKILEYIEKSNKLLNYKDFRKFIK